MPVKDAPGGSDGKESAYNAGDQGSIPGKIPWRREWYPLQYFCLGNSKDRGPWLATVHGVSELDMTEQLTHIGKKHTLNIYRSQYLYYQRSPLGYSPWGRKESDTTEWLNTLYQLKNPWHFNKAPLSFSHAKKIVLLYNASISQLSMAITLILIIFIKNQPLMSWDILMLCVELNVQNTYPLLPIYLGYCFG